jgi:hypothetical protein
MRGAEEIRGGERRVMGVRTSDTMEDTGISGCSMTLVLQNRLKRGGDAFLGRMRVGIGMRRGTEERHGERREIVRGRGSRGSERIYCRYRLMFRVNVDDVLSDLGLVRI